MIIITRCLDQSRFSRKTKSRELADCSSLESVYSADTAAPLGAALSVTFSNALECVFKVLQ